MIVGDQPGDTTVSVHASGPALLVLNDAFAPGWVAEIDGRPATLLAADVLVRAVPHGVGEGPSGTQVLVIEIPDEFPLPSSHYEREGVSPSFLAYLRRSFARIIAD